MKYSHDKLEAVAEQLRSLPPVNSSPTHSKAEAVQFLAGEIEELQKRGYSFAQIADALSNNGVDISAKTLRAYFYRARTKAAPLKKPAANTKGNTQGNGGSKRKAPQEKPPKNASRAHFVPREDTPEDEL